MHELVRVLHVFTRKTRGLPPVLLGELGGLRMFDLGVSMNGRVNHTTIFINMFRIPNVCGRSPRHARHMAAWSQAPSLPDLPFDYGALEPVVNAEIMTLHHKKHHQVSTRC